MEPLGAGDPANIGPFALQARLGSGGMGTVYLARSPSGRTVAVKTVRPELTGDGGFRERFRREVEAARSVSGFFTASVVDADVEAAVPWVATVYVDAPDLATLTAERGPLLGRDVRALGAGLAEALAAIHRTGVVHRDLKPSNILVTSDGPRIIDFGISRALSDGPALTTLGAAIGTPGFMSPEQAQGLAISPASDVFSLGAVLYHAAVGRGPFGTGTAHVLLYRVVHDQPDLTGLPAELRPVIEGCLAKQPHQRPMPDELLQWLAPGAAVRDLAVPVGMGAEPQWWEQPTVPAPAVDLAAKIARPPAEDGIPVAPSPPGTGADIAWWSTGGRPVEEATDFSGPGFPVGREAVDAYRERRRIRDRGDRGRAPGPRVDEPLDPGDVVEHTKYGIGTVLEVLDTDQVLIAFGPRHGERRIMLRYAPMQKISSP
ncbi:MULTISPECIES: serine/threonine-protein kinase [unclassified Streptomyces]|uniref:serine/threonine-protein kinase n=1 Tax=unclassified Streptomyces TaxID=2593676 RepID=UPI00382F65DA